MKSPFLTDLIHNYTSIIETISGEITSSDPPDTQSYIIETISGEITSSDWPDTQSYINYRHLIFWNHQFWPTWYTLYISELYRTYLVKSPVLTDLIHNHTSIIETISGEITSSDPPDTQSYIIETISGEITSSDWPDTQLYINYRDHIWWNHQFWLTWYTIIHQL